MSTLSHASGLFGIVGVSTQTSLVIGLSTDLVALALIVKVCDSFTLSVGMVVVHTPFLSSPTGAEMN